MPHSSARLLLAPIIPLALAASAAHAASPDLAETYNVPYRTGKAPGVVMLCPSTDGSYTAQACASGSAVAQQHVVVDPGVNVIGAVSQAPTAAAALALSAVSSAAPEAAHVLKAAPGNLYGFSVIAGSASGYVLLLDAASVPGDGPVQPKKCYPLGVGGVLAASWQPGPPVAFANGITVVFSATGCFTKTATAAAFISGEVQ